MNIATKIKNSVREALGDEYPFYYLSDNQANLETGRMEFPCAVLRLITDGEIVQEAQQAKERVAAALFFLDLTEFDFDSEENEQIIEERKADALLWLLSVARSRELRVNPPTRTSRVYDRFDDIVTGYGLLAEVKELDGVAACQTPEPDPEPEAPQDNENDLNTQDNEIQD